MFAGTCEIVGGGCRFGQLVVVKCSLYMPVFGCVLHTSMRLLLWVMCCGVLCADDHMACVHMRSMLSRMGCRAPESHALLEVPGRDAPRWGR
jgi:hypothetical protein